MSKTDTEQTFLSSLDLAIEIPQLTTVQSIQLWDELKKTKEIVKQTKQNNELKEEIKKWNELAFAKAYELFNKVESFIMEGTKNQRKQIKIASHIGFYKGMKNEEWIDAVLWSGNFKDNDKVFQFISYPQYLKDLLSKTKDYHDCQITISKKSLFDDKKQPKGVVFMTFLKWGDENTKSS
jgi:hypothetical protein